MFIAWRNSNVNTQPVDPKPPATDTDPLWDQRKCANPKTSPPAGCKVWL